MKLHREGHESFSFPNFEFGFAFVDGGDFFLYARVLVLNVSLNVRGDGGTVIHPFPIAGGLFGSELGVFVIAIAENQEDQDS